MYDTAHSSNLLQEDSSDDEYVSGILPQDNTFIKVRRV